jgi:peptidyl-prolyl cis-trans isomerase B (cyclophilin B)
MAQLGRDTGCCQFFITLAARPHLDGEYTLFGRVQQGMGVVRKLMPGDQVLKADWIRGE